MDAFSLYFLIRSEIMKNFKFLSVLLIAALLVLTSFGTVKAVNNNNPDTPVAGVVQSITVETDPITFVTTVVVSITDANDVTSDVRLTLEAALTLGLVSLEVNLDQVDLPLTIDPLIVIPEDGGLPPPPDVPITGTIKAIEIQVDTDTLVTTVVVTLEGVDAVLTPYRLSPDTAVGLDLITVVAVDAMIGQTITVNPEDLAPEDTTSTHPIDQILGDFLANLLGVDPAIVSDYHEQGMGYGLIAQAGILSYALDGDATMMQTILDAKLTGDFSTVVLPDGTTPSNWGELRKVVIDQKGSLKNLGNIVSGHAEEDMNTVDTNTDQDQNNNGNNGKGHKNDNSNNGKSKNH
jgi:hypothetical protein